ncbi:uncharacterized protein MYCFIDRAFT_144654, partial [Pseudocercospora fijiensis CIRAD86]
RLGPGFEDAEATSVSIASPRLLWRCRTKVDHVRCSKILRDTIQGVTRGDIRRLARRGGVKRIAGTIYEETRSVLRKRLTVLLADICAVVELSGRKTVCVTDVVFVLNRHGTPVYGFGLPER